jgi:hypothetical protein
VQNALQLFKTRQPYSHVHAVSRVADCGEMHLGQTGEGGMSEPVLSAFPLKYRLHHIDPFVLRIVIWQYTFKNELTFTKSRLLTKFRGFTISVHF